MSKYLEPGMTFPDFELPDDSGVMHRLSELQGDNAMVLMLGRGEHCPRERQHQFEMVRFNQWQPVAFTELVTILPNDLHDTNKMKIATGAHWTYLADADLEVQRHFEIDEYTDAHHAATVPHTVVLAPGLVIDKVYVGYWFWGRPSPYQLWEDLQGLFRRTKPDFDPTTAEARAAWAAANGAEPPKRRRTKATA
jgi:peroxiredoxin